MRSGIRFSFRAFHVPATSVNILTFSIFRTLHVWNILGELCEPEAPRAPPSSHPPSPTSASDPSCLWKDCCNNKTSQLEAVHILRYTNLWFWETPSPPPYVILQDHPLILYCVIYGHPLIVKGPDFHLSDSPELASKIADGCINKWHLNNLKVTNFENNMLPNLENTWIGWLWEDLPPAHSPGQLPPEGNRVGSW